MRILSFDIECAGRPGVFPEPEKDPVIQIANHVMLQGENKAVVKNIFTLKECAPIGRAGALLRHGGGDAQVVARLRARSRRRHHHRLQHHQLRPAVPAQPRRSAEAQGFPYLGRIKGIADAIKDKVFQSKQTGTRESKEINIEGRVQFDVMAVLMRASTKLSSYPHPIAQLRLRALPRRAEGGRPPLDHLRPPGGQRRHAPPPRRLLPQGRVPASARVSSRS